MTVLQMAGMYQAIANDGLRVEPRIVKAKVNPDGTTVPELRRSRCRWFPRRRRRRCAT